MKLSLRIFALLILLASGILVSASPLAQTEPPPPLSPVFDGYYAGRLILKINYALDWQGAFVKTTWRVKNGIHMVFSMNSRRMASVMLSRDGQVYVTYVSFAKNETCPNRIELAKGLTREKLMIKDENVYSYDPERKVFMVPYGMPQDFPPAWIYLVQYGGCLAEGWSAVPCQGEACEDYFWKPDVSVSKIINTMKIYITKISANKLEGVCKLSLWDDLPPSNGYEWDTECTWYAEKKPADAPEWIKVK